MKDMFAHLHNFMLGVKSETPRPEFNEIPEVKPIKIPVIKDKSKVLYIKLQSTKNPDDYMPLDTYYEGVINTGDILYNPRTQEVMSINFLRISDQGIIATVGLTRGLENTKKVPFANTETLMVVPQE